MSFSMSRCVSPPELDNWQLAAFVAGEADQATIDHIARCPHCRANAAQAARIHQSLARPLFRLHCPSADELRDYHFAFLSQARMGEISDHLQSCARCTREIAQLEEFMMATEMPSESTEIAGISGSAVAQNLPLGEIARRVRTILATLMPRPPAGATLIPALGALRGGEGASPFLYQADEWQIAVESVRDLHHPQARIVLGAIWGGDAEGWLAHLWQSQHHLDSTLVDELGAFRFINIAPTTYEIILVGPDITIQLAPITVT